MGHAIAHKSPALGGAPGNAVLGTNSSDWATYETGGSIRALFWLYLVLVVFEGALRKWVLPGFSDYLLFARDPVVVLILAISFAKGIFPVDTKNLILYAIAAISTAASVLVNFDHPLVTIVGFKSNFLHLPLLAVVPRVLNKRDCLRMGKFLMCVSIAMLPTMVLQFEGAKDSVWNVGAGGKGGQIDGAMGKIRGAGFFSYSTGVVQFCGVVAAFVLHGLIEPRSYNRLLVLGAGAALIMTVALSISRSAVAAVATVFLAMMVLSLLNRAFAGKMTLALGLIGVLFLAISSLDVFQEGMEAMQARLGNTGDMDRGFAQTVVNWTQRVFGDLISGVNAAGYAPIMGFGIGYGTTSGSVLMSGAMSFLLAEGEWPRVVLEMGPIFGFAYLGVRVAITVSLFRLACEMGRRGNGLPMLLFGSSLWLIFNGQFGQATTVGFTVVACSLAVASAADTELVEPEDTGFDLNAPVRCRSRYAEFLHGKVLK